MAKVTPAAGAVVTDADSVVVIHRRRYDDWCLPKGKLNAGEAPSVAAIRECHEETGVRARLTCPLDRVTYPVGNGHKVVDWWRAVPVADDGGPLDRSEVDAVHRWSVDRAVEALSYADERWILTQAIAQPATTPLIVLRHGKAIERKHWDGPDGPRPLAASGCDQASELADVLRAYGIRRVTSSSWTRCMSTVAEYAASDHLLIEPLEALTEDGAEADPAGVVAAMADLVAECARGVPTVVCGHRPVLPLMLDCLDVPEHALKPAEAVIAHVTVDGGVHAVELYPRL